MIRSIHYHKSSLTALSEMSANCHKIRSKELTPSTYTYSYTLSTYSSSIRTRVGPSNSNLPPHKIDFCTIKHFSNTMLASSQLVHRLGWLAVQTSRCSQALLQQSCEFSAAAASTAKSTYNVPEGHHNSDLSSTACHIGLGRRRDLTMRQDLKLWDGDKPLSLADVFHVSRICISSSTC